VYVLECDHRLLGFVVLVLDEVGWRHEKRARCGSTMQYLAAAIQSPLLTVRDVLHRIRLRYGRFSEISPDEERRGARAWIELIAVERANRRMGIANRLQGQCEERTLAMGRPRLELNVDPGNQEMRRFVARRGYEWTGTTRTGCLYSLLLGSDEARTS
jgi:GNAT superfamily N-acetyltransferase